MVQVRRSPSFLSFPPLFLFLAAGVSITCGTGSAMASTGMSFLRIGAGARAIAMGDAVVSQVDDAAATYWNPGALPLLGGNEAEMMHNESFQGVRYEFVSLARGSGHHGVGLAFNGVWTDDLRAYDEKGEFLGHFGYYGVALSGSYGYAITDRLGIGAGVEYLREAVDIYSADGPAFNIGMQWRDLLPCTSVGLAVLHLGSSMTYEEDPFDLPTTVQGGVSHSLPLGPLSGRLLLSAEVRKTKDEDAHLLFGSEYSYQDLASLQMGYRTGMDTQDISAGFGVGRGHVRGQYAFVPFSENLGDQHRLSLLMRW